MNTFPILLVSAFSPYDGMVRPAMPQAFNRAIGSPNHPSTPDAASRPQLRIDVKATFSGLSGVDRFPFEASLYGQGYVVQSARAEPYMSRDAERTPTYSLEFQKKSDDDNTNSLPSPLPLYDQFKSTGEALAAAVPTSPEYLDNQPRTPYPKDGPFLFSPLYEAPGPSAIPRWGRDQPAPVEDHSMLSCRTDRSIPNPTDTVNAGCRLHRILGIQSSNVAGATSIRSSGHETTTKSDSFLPLLFKNNKNRKGIGLRRERIGWDKPQVKVHPRWSSNITCVDDKLSPTLSAWWPPSDTWTGRHKELPHPGSFSTSGYVAAQYPYW